MEPLKLSKGNSPSATSSPKQTGSVPIAVRFNAGDECIDEIYQPYSSGDGGGGGGGGNNSGSVSGGGTIGGSGGNATKEFQRNSSTNNNNSANSGGGDSLSSSPSQLPAVTNADEANTKNFLQGNFFSRKRSGSIEGVSPTSSAPNLIAALSSGDAASVGTWKLIKGKVSQTIEEIKSSKTGSSSTSQVGPIPTIVTKEELGQQQLQVEPDSDQDNATLNNSISEDLPLDQEHFQAPSQTTIKYHHNQEASAHMRSPNGFESDSDLESDLIIVEGSGDFERSRLRRGLANLKSKVKSKTLASSHQQQQTLTSSSSSGAIAKPNKKDLSPVAAPTSGTSIRSALLRKRRKAPFESAEAVAISVPPEIKISSERTSKSSTKKHFRNIISGKKDVEIESGVEMHEDTIPLTEPSGSHKKKEHHADAPATGTKHIAVKETSTSAHATKKFEKLSSTPEMLVPQASAVSQPRTFIHALREECLHYLTRAITNVPFMCVVCIIAILMFSIPPFISGVLICLLSICFLESVWTFLQEFIEKYLVTNPPEKTKFEIPDYSKMSICEIPAVEEHKTIKIYSGWMNEINSYDPDNFHISMTKSVYVKLDGTMLRISSTNARLPKKAMWNEPPIDRKNIIYTSHRLYNLLGCRVELLPIGLARKRYFNRKYPIQLIIKNGCVEQTPYENSESKQSSTGNNQEEAETFLDGKDAKPSPMLHAASNVSESQQEDRSDRPVYPEPEAEMDLGATLLGADVQVLQETVSESTIENFETIPCGDEVRLLLFTRDDRSKEDWYRRFIAAGKGEVHDQVLHLPDFKIVSDEELQAAVAKTSQRLNVSKSKDLNRLDEKSSSNLYLNLDGSDSLKIKLQEVPKPANTPTDKESVDKLSSKSNLSIDKDMFEDIELEDEADDQPILDENFEGLLMNADAARNPADYLRFMALYQKTCTETHVPIFKNVPAAVEVKPHGRNRRAKRQEDELWRGIDQSLFLGPSDSVVWANVLIGRLVYSCLNNGEVIAKAQEFLQKKLNAVKFPSFMENVLITQMNLGNTPPLIHRISRPILDERGTWIDADITYEGHVHLTVTAKLNLLGLKRHGRSAMTLNIPTTAPTIQLQSNSQTGPDDTQTRDSFPLEELTEVRSSNAIYDSDAESSGGSTSETESPPPGSSSDPNHTDFHPTAYNSPGNARRIFRMVDRFTASNFFHYATELPYVQRAMENMNANITLEIDLKGLVARGVINIPPPPSDRIWLSFRGPPRIWISAKPAVGEKFFDWSIVTNVIESKLCEEINKYLVYPNMTDIYSPLLGHPTYQE